MTLDYRTPQTGMHPVQRVMLDLAAARAMTWGAVIAKLALGIPLALFGPFLVTCVLFGIEEKWQAERLPGFGVTLLVVSLVVLPVLMIKARRTQGDFIGETLQGMDASRPSSRGEWEMRGAYAFWVSVIGVALYGPKLIWSVIDFLRNRASDETPLRAVAAQIVVELMEQEHARTVRELVRPGRSPSLVREALGFLQDCDWIDQSRKRDRVWLRSGTRNRLANS